MIDSAACDSLELGEVMASAEALAELRDLVNSVILHAGTPLEKMPVEAPHDPKQQTGYTDEPAALAEPRQSICPRTKSASCPRRSPI